MILRKYVIEQQTAPVCRMRRDSCDGGYRQSITRVYLIVLKAYYIFYKKGSAIIKNNSRSIEQYRYGKSFNKIFEGRQKQS